MGNFSGPAVCFPAVQPPRESNESQRPRLLARIFFCFKLILALPESVLEYYWIKTFAPAPKLFTAAAAAACVELAKTFSRTTVIFPC